MTPATSALSGDRVIQNIVAAAGTRIDRPLIGEPLTIGGRTIRPAARLSGRVEGRAGGGGGHGTAMGKAQPLGVLRITADSVHFEPLMDPKAIALAGIALAAWNVFWIAATVRAFARR